MPAGWPLHIDGAVRQCCIHRAASLQELDDMLKEYDMKRDSVEINHAPQWSHHAVWNRRYMEPKPGYTLQQLWADSEPTIGKKTSASYEIKTNDVLRAVAAIQHLPSPMPPDSPFLSALGTSATLKAPPQTDTLAQRALEEWERTRRPCGVVGSADRLPVVVRFPAGLQVSLKCGDQSKDNGAGHKKMEEWERTLCENKAVAILAEVQAGRPTLIHKDGGEMLIAIVLDRPLAFFCGRRPLPFSGSHLRLPSGPAGIRTTTGSLSALARPTPYQLSHRVALLDRPLAEAKALVDDPAAFTREMTRILREKQNHPLIAQMMKPAESGDLPPANTAASSAGSSEETRTTSHVQFQ